jgi:polar amino acid transport system permease protein
MALATALGTIMGLATLAKSGLIRVPSFLVMNFLRNSPWLVLLFAMLYILPFEMHVFGLIIQFPPFVKAVIGLALPTAANFSEVIRGAVQSIHGGQWEAARSLGYTTGQIYRHVIMPQALRRMIPGWMNLYALLMIATALATVTGIQDVLTVLNTSLAMEGERVIVYFYLTILFLFFAYCYPIAVVARRLERVVKGDNL